MSRRLTLLRKVRPRTVTIVIEFDVGNDNGRGRKEVPLENLRQ